MNTATEAAWRAFVSAADKLGRILLDTSAKHESAVPYPDFVYDCYQSNRALHRLLNCRDVPDESCPLAPDFIEERIGELRRERDEAIAGQLHANHIAADERDRCVEAIGRAERAEEALAAVRKFIGVGA